MPGPDARSLPTVNRGHFAFLVGPACWEAGPDKRHVPFSPYVAVIVESATRCVPGRVLMTA
jgi:hypothetical protein